MQQAEVFHIYHLGEQRGPYSARQVNHLYRCGYICDETLYWRDGMEQWQPITEIVERRIRRKRLMKWGVGAGVIAVLALLVLLFGSVTRDAWRELTSGEFTAESAWWRARGMVREKLSGTAAVAFDPIASAQVELIGKDAAVVVLGGDVTDSSGNTTRTSWKVRMQYDADGRLWQPALAAPAAAAAPTATAAPGDAPDPRASASVQPPQ
jgi:hypothetical protein